MAISAAKIKSVCTNAETALVRASRKPELGLHKPARLNQLTSRARKLARKWQTLERDQARSRGRATGHTEGDTNTALKAEIFRDALAAFEAQAAKLGSAATAKKPAKPSKKDRSAEHRTRRAAIRKGMTAAEDLMNLPSAKPAKSAGAPSSAAEAVSPTPVPAAPTPKVKVKKPAAAVKPATKPSAAKAAIHPAKQRGAVTAAKKSRVAMSGKQTRALGHLKASTKRSQAKRDSK